MGSRQSCQQVVNVHLAGQPRCHLGSPGRCLQFKNRPARRERISGRAPVAFADSVGTNLRARPHGGSTQPLAARVVRIDHSHARRRINRPVKQQPLGREVLLHGLVIIEVVLREIGEDGHVESHSGSAPLVERVA